MSFGLPVSLAYSVVESASTLLSPLFGGAATAAAIVLATALVRLLLIPLTFRQIAVERRRARLAPQVTTLRGKHRDDPLQAATEVAALYRAEGVGALPTLLPLLVQAPFFLTLYSLFTASTVDGAPNALLGHALGGVPLGDHWRDGALLGVHGLVFAVVLGLFVVTATVTARRLRRLGQPAWLSYIPFVSVVFAATVPLAAALYLLTSTIWTTLENVLLRDRLIRPPA
ncbi:membrane protein insertase YidC [Cryptosporangium aurantiacum]|uniref:Membrane protein insertase YidC n=1 Tax=Cryptosporangium aurantiacum TaxID=134849 RepID=A0A1M7RMD0_9ACTN|nr:membrane protein insertase YidC [Cryptosporangium aurantiacum]SHN47341.1 YidC/Oxa1 family membrane protein insertase [Cryptosporangium aurantiacum]